MTGPRLPLDDGIIADAITRELTHLAINAANPVTGRMLRHLLAHALERLGLHDAPSARPKGIHSDREHLIYNYRKTVRAQIRGLSDKDFAAAMRGMRQKHAARDFAARPPRGSVAAFEWRKLQIVTSMLNSEARRRPKVEI